MNNFLDQRGKEKKLKISEKKDCCIKSLFEVNSFLCNAKKAKIAFCLFKWFK